MPYRKKTFQQNRKDVSKNLRSPSFNYFCITESTKDSVMFFIE